MSSFASRRSSARRVSAAQRLAEKWAGRGESALSLDFTDDSLQGVAGRYGSAFITDNTTLANGFNGDPYSLLTYTSPSPKMTRGPDGLLMFREQNLCLQSENFATTWTNVASSEASGATPPSGRTTAWTVTADGTTSIHTIRQDLTIVSGATYALTADLKAGTLNNVIVNFRAINGGHWVSCVFDLANGVVGQDGVGGTSGTFVSANMESIGDGWYRCTVIGSVAQTEGRPSFAAASAANGITFDSSGAESFATSGTFLITGAHLRRTPSASTYLATTTAARYGLPFEWGTDGLLSSGGLLVEEARTNLCLQSDDLTNASWTKQGITAAKTATGPDGVTNSASTLTATTADGTANIGITSASSARITSCYVKRRTGSGSVFLSQGGSTGSTLVINGTFDADTDWTKGTGWTISGGVAARSATGSVSSLRQTTGTITAGKPYQLSLTVARTAGTLSVFLGSVFVADIAASGTYTYNVVCGTTGTLRIGLDGNATWDGTVDDVIVLDSPETSLTVTGGWTRVETPSATIANPRLAIRLATSGDAVDVALVQHELGAFVTSPIPTLASTVTRAVDNISLATSAFPYSSTATTLYAQASLLTTQSGATDCTWAVITNGTNANDSLIIRQAGATKRFQSYGSDVSAADQWVIGEASGDRSASSAVGKIAVGYAVNDVAFCGNGTLIGTDVSATNGAGNTLVIGGQGFSAAGILNGYVKQVLYLPRRASNAKLQAMTQAA
jgi:hypothetical protein